MKHPKAIATNLLVEWLAKADVTLAVDSINKWRDLEWLIEEVIRVERSRVLPSETKSRDVLELVTKCNLCKRAIVDGGVYYKHLQLGIVCEHCPEFQDGGVELSSEETEQHTEAKDNGARAKEVLEKYVGDVE